MSESSLSDLWHFLAHNQPTNQTHIRLGDSFLETVCPTDRAWAATTTQTKLLNKNGDCGYMAIVQVPDVAVASQSMAVQGEGRGIVAGEWRMECVPCHYHVQHVWWC